RDRRDDPNRIESGALPEKHGFRAGGSVDDEEADLVLGDVNRAFEADRQVLLRQLRRGRACPPLAVSSLTRSATGEIRLDKVARHALDAMGRAVPRKGRNVSTLLGRA